MKSCDHTRAPVALSIAKSSRLELVAYTRLPTMSGVEATKRIRLQSPSTVVIGLTAGTPDHKDMAMISAGADQVIDKVDVVCRLYAAIVDAVSRLKTAI